MKILFFLIAALLCFNISAFSELTVADLEKIRQMNTETETRLEKRISAEIKALGELFRTEIQALSKRLDFQGQLMIALIIALVTAHLGIIVYQNNKRDTQHAEKIETLRHEHAKEMAVLHEKIEALEAIIARA